MESKYQELLIKIDGRIKELSYELENDNNTRTEYLSTFFEKCSLKDMSTIFNISSSELLLALLLEADRKTDIFLKPLKETQKTECSNVRLYQPINSTHTINFKLPIINSFMND